jgi:glucose dehydrogenase
MDCDFLIVGGGVAGALMAHQLAKAGRATMLVEAGSAVERKAALAQWAKAGRKGLEAPYSTPDGERFAPFPGVVPKVGEGDQFKSTWLRRAGGSTWHWLGNTPRMIPSDFRLAERYGKAVDWPISYDDLEPWYGDAEAALGVSGSDEEWQDVLEAHRSARFPMPPIWPSWSDRQLKARLEGTRVDGVEVRIRAVPQARNSQPYQGRPPCAGNSTCIPLCPIGAKYDAGVHLALARQAGAAIRERCVATRVVASGRRITGIEVADWSSGEPRRQTLSARYYVLAAHTVETARLLLISRVANSSGRVGHYIMDHPGGSIAGLTPEPWYPFRGPPVTSGIDEWRDGEFRSRYSAWRISLGNDGQGRVRSAEAFATEQLDAGLLGAPLRGALEQGARLFRMSWATEQLPDENNRVELLSETEPGLGIPKAGIRYRMDPYALAAFPHIGAVVRALFERAGITEPRGGDASAWTGSGHVLGSCRMGQDARTSVVDRDCRAHDCDNLFIVGGAVFPTVGTANPTLTVAALALRAAGLLARA